MMRTAGAAMAAVLAAGAAQAATRNYPVGGFDRVASSVPFDVRVHVGGPFGARAEGDQEALDRLELVVERGTLKIRTVRDSWWRGWNRGRQRATIEVSLPALNGVALSGPGNMGVDRVNAREFDASLSGPGDLRIGMLETGSVRLNLSGPGNIDVAGHARSADLHLSGPGDIRAGALAVRDATVSLSGSGDIAIAAAGVVQGSLSGPGDITVTGGARCMIRKSGPGDVRCR